MGVEVGVDVTVGGGIAAHVGEARAFVFTEGGGFGKGDVVYRVSNEAVCGVEGFVREFSVTSSWSLRAFLSLRYLRILASPSPDE